MLNLSFIMKGPKSEESEMTEQHKFSGRVFCILSKENSEYDNGMRGAYVTFACRAEDIEAATILVTQEMKDIHLIVMGFENFYDQRFMDGTPTEYERTLLEKLDSYPVQFKEVHYFPPDS